MRASMGWFCLALAWLSACTAFADDASGLAVTGHGEVEKEPDLARFTFEVLRQGSDAAALKREVDGVTGAVVALAERQGVARDDITAAAIQVRPEYRYQDGRSILEGVSVSRTIRVELRDLSRYGAVTNGALEAGVNQLQGVELDFADRAALEQQALDAAVDQARAEAGHVAGRLGMRLGRVLEVQLHDRAGGPVLPMPMGMAKGMAQEADSFRPGTLVVSRQVQVRFDLVVP